jgi:hypothetical protein
MLLGSGGAEAFCKSCCAGNNITIIQTKKSYVGMCFLLPTAKAIITINLEYVSLNFFTYLTKGEE